MAEEIPDPITAALAEPSASKASTKLRLPKNLVDVTARKAGEMLVIVGMPPYTPTRAMRSKRAFTPVQFPAGWVDTTLTGSGETVTIIGSPFSPPKKKLPAD